MQAAPTAAPAKRTETTFASVDSTVAAQWDFPSTTPAPLVLIIPPSAMMDRNGLPPGFEERADAGVYHKLAGNLLAAGFAVFRYDAPGAGKSSRGRYATPRSTALEAYIRAVDHARVDKRKVFLLAHGTGTDVVANIFARFADSNPVAGVALLSNIVSEPKIRDITAPALIVVSGDHPDDEYTYGQFAAEGRTRNATPPLPTEFEMIRGVEHSLLEETPETGEKTYGLHPNAIHSVLKWLRGQMAAPENGIASATAGDSA